ncbi:MAG: ABC transporter permease subunit [Candidatus Lokiarchaeota archaeon]|nr:ABC transporter permease subunit [Candidatus Lokiarchaeota archaeon]
MEKFNSFMMFLASFFTIYVLVSIFYLFTAFSYGPLILDYLFSYQVLLALWVSISSSTIVVIISLIFGIPTAWILANKDFKNKTILETLIVDIPHSFPPGVVGTTYLLMFQPTSPIGMILNTLGLNIINTFWAMILVKTFISAPFLVGILTMKFRQLRESELEVIAKSLGASDYKTFYSITLPLSKKAMVAGSARCWARALGEIAGTIVFAGAIIPGVTQTMPAIIVFEAQTSLPAALTLALILAIISITILIVFKLLLERKK